ncbi:DNA (cytosine-5)-methyltransferase 3B-like [Pollicipes pollicipes]|uniref:DNA (cytosine-5)-methyltransferase 3B-like n=1 Tax=Pollicipes pollicipes TaxID=41117 RepID=UPI0018851255|nr:DNA (cytosine-5)-methyltransferase 3B-like [Pollicipes pollicipes]
MEERTVQLRQELALTHLATTSLPPLRHDLFLIRMGGGRERSPEPAADAPMQRAPSSRCAGLEDQACEAGLDPSVWGALTEGSLVWAKLGASKWWPGMLVKGERGGMLASRDRPWVYWFGDHRISEVARDRVVEFAAGFRSLVQPAYRLQAYQLGLVEALRECRRRLGLDPVAGSTHQVISWGQSAIDDGLTFEDVSIPARVLSPLAAEWLRRTADPSAGLEAVCVACGSPEVADGHPLVVGGLCAPCQDAIRDTMFAIAEDGISPYCVVCSRLGQLLICDEMSCNSGLRACRCDGGLVYALLRCHRGFCSVCLSVLIDAGAPERLAALPTWRCPLCHVSGDASPLRGRADWKHRVARLFTPRSCPTLRLPVEQFKNRRPIRVLSLFDGIATGMQVLSQLGVAVEVYLAAETDPDAIHVTAMNHPRVTQLGAVETLTDVKISELAPVDLVLAGSPCTDLSVVNPARRGLYDPEGTGILFFDFYRILRSVEVCNEGRHVFWLFENVASMPLEYRKVISRFLQMEPALIDAKHFSPQSRPRFFWGNIPGLFTPLPPHLLNSEHSIAPCLVLPSRQPATDQVGCVTTSRNSLRQGRLSLSPVVMDGQGDVMWITEIEQMFGLPRHYTDLGSLGPQRRQQLLGRAWSAPVVRHILSSLTPFFSGASSDTSSAA